MRRKWHVFYCNDDIHLNVTYRLTIMADKLDNAIGAKVGFWSKIAMVKTISISRQVHTFVESAEDFRFTVQVCNYTLSPAHTDQSDRKRRI